VKGSIERDEEKSNGAKVKMDQPLRGMPHPFGKLHPRMYAAEFAGTTLLVFFWALDCHRDVGSQRALCRSPDFS